MTTRSAVTVRDRDELAILRRVRASSFEKDANILSQAAASVGKFFGRKAAPAAANAVAHAAPAVAHAAPAAGGGFRAGLAEFRAGLSSGRKFNIGAPEAAQAAPSLWRSVGHNMADQAVGGAIGGTVLGGAMGAYQAPKGQGFAGAAAGAGEGFKAGLIGGAVAGAAGGAMRHGRYKALVHSGSTPEAATAVMSKSPLQNVQDAWANKGNPGSWQADALEAAAVPATLVAENMATGIGEMKNEKTAAVPSESPAPPAKQKKRTVRAAVHLTHAEEKHLLSAAKAVLRAVRASRIAKIAALPEGDPQRPHPQIVVVPMMHGREKTPAERVAEKHERNRLETDQAVGRAIGPLAGTFGAEALLRSTVDPAVRRSPTGALSMLTPDSVPRKILLPGLGAALGGYAAHRLIQARREFRERQNREELAQETAKDARRHAAVAASPVTPSLGSALMQASNG